MVRSPVPCTFLEELLLDDQLPDLSLHPGAPIFQLPQPVIRRALARKEQAEVDKDTQTKNIRR